MYGKYVHIRELAITYILRNIVVANSYHLAITSHRHLIGIIILIFTLYHVNMCIGDNYLFTIYRFEERF